MSKRDYCKNPLSLVECYIEICNVRFISCSVTYVTKMDFGEAKFILSKYLVGKILIVGSISQPKHVHKFRSTTISQLSYRLICST